MKRRGISLITLVITIVIIIILAGAVILNLSDNNPVESAKKATVMQDIDTFRTELTLKLTTGYTNGIFDTKSINAVTKEDILKYIPSMKEVKIGKSLYTDILVISEGELKVDGTKANEAISNGKLTKEQYDWIVEALGNNVFNAQTYSIKYYTNDGTEEYTESSKIHNVKYVILSNIKDRNGYGFKNWNTEKDGTGTTYNVGDEYTLNEALTLYAQWEAGTYTVTYYKNDGTDEAKTELKTQDVPYEIEDQSFTREGYTFVGYNTSPDGTGTDYAVGSSYAENAGLELYAKWDIIAYSITYYKNDGTTESIVDTKNHGNIYNVKNQGYTRTGYTFLGYNTSKDGNGIDYMVDASYSDNANLELYAKWKVNGTSAIGALMNANKYYGAYVNYKPSNGCQVKWRVFYADYSNIYLIAEDYVYKAYLEDVGFKTTTSEGWKVYSNSNRSDVLYRLTTSSFYTGFKDSSGKADSVVGAPTLEQFIESYNEVNTNSEGVIYIKYFESGEVIKEYDDGDNEYAKVEGYLLKCGSSENWGSSMKIPANANKYDLYVRTSNTYASAMWIAAFAATYRQHMFCIEYPGTIGVSGNIYTYGYDSYKHGIRPLVKLNSNVKLVDEDGDGIYDLE